MKSPELKNGRLIFIYFGLVFAFLIIISRLIYFGSFGDKVRINRIYSPSKINVRGDILDRNNLLIATDIKTKNLYVSSILIKDERLIALGLSKIFSDLSYQEILQKIRIGKNRHDWILIKRNVTPLQERKVRRLKKAGLIFEKDSVRIYTQRSIFSHLVGYVDLDRRGLSGIENEYNKTLLDKEEDIKIAADIRLQDILNNELQKGLEEFDAKAASGIIMNVNNGEVLALSSLPDFDPNLQSQASSNQRFNRVVSGSYEFGSIFKIFTNAMAFDKNIIKIDDIFNVSEPIKKGRFTINDDHNDKDELSVADIFAKSSNIGTVKIAQEIGIKTQKEYLRRFGFLQKVNTNFPGLAKPIYPKKWREINLYTISYGHGIAVTPLHIASAVSAVVNGGILFPPSFLKLGPKAEGTRVIKESTSALMRVMLRNAVEDGTGSKANIEGYMVGGKTGTAEKAEGGSYSKKRNISSFVGVFPMDNPQYLVYVVLDDANYKFSTGGMIAAPVAGNIIKNIAPILGVLPR